mmetsp:Transcript_42992/g.68102  ORF Transcript_42992/g.68102 Transcript_42992/m.68102 type:complete len:192 (+) Transcript_42992:2-577(+)
MEPVDPSRSVDRVLPTLPLLPLQSLRCGEDSELKNCCRESVGTGELLVDRASCDGDMVQQVPLRLKETGDGLLLAPLETGGHLVPMLPALPTPMRNARSTGANSGAPSEGLVKVLNGKWFLQSNERPLCDIWNLEIYFDPDTSLKDTLHFLRIEEGTAVSLRMNGQLLLGEVSVDAQPRISWKHGETWIKK